ncbi:hypothetical protein [Synechococcus sp. KORDI-52]|uniref:hypothetical protein n=1 Tax=Synechococcus sp. KORDI-52 TaxID=585425 RepID=UPI00068C6C17|nr:hypothetical protein [Synechococcus sp. KORDI-52]
MTPPSSPPPLGSPSPADSGLYLVPYWVRGGRLWGLIALVLVLGGILVPMVLSAVQRQASSRGFGRGVATSLCSLAHTSSDLSRDDALAQLKEIQTSFVRTRAVDAEAFLRGVDQVATSLPACRFLSEP